MSAEAIVLKKKNSNPDLMFVSPRGPILTSLFLVWLLGPFGIGLAALMVVMMLGLGVLAPVLLSVLLGMAALGWMGGAGKFAGLLLFFWAVRVSRPAEKPIDLYDIEQVKAYDYSKFQPVER
jgi:hypothetical protein